MSEKNEINNEQKNLKNNDKQILIEFYKTQWSKVHDFNNLDWRVMLLFVPLVGAVSVVFGIALELDLHEMITFIDAIKAISLICFMLCSYGLWTVAKGQFSLMLKLKTLRMIEHDLGYDRYIIHRKGKFKLIWPFFVARRTTLYFVYLVLSITSFSMWIIPITDFNIINIWHNPCTLLPPSILAFIILVIHGIDYRVHEKKGEKSYE